MRLRTQGENARHGQSGGMGNAESPTSHSQRRSGLRGAAVESDFRCFARRAVDHHIGECNAGAKARAERLKHGLLGGKPPCQALDPIGTIANLVEFGLHETARDQRVARILDPAPNLGDVDQINSMSDNVHNPRRYFSEVSKTRAALGFRVIE